MKRTVILVVVIMVIGVCLGGWDSARPAKPAADLREFLLPVPDATKYTYGNSDRTQVLFNIIAIKESCVGYEKELKRLAAEIAELKKQVAILNTSNEQRATSDERPE